VLDPEADDPRKLNGASQMLFELATLVDPALFHVPILVRPFRYALLFLCSDFCLLVQALYTTLGSEDSIEKRPLSPQLRRNNPIPRAADTCVCVCVCYVGS
jgi:hypothetical protein